MSQEYYNSVTAGAAAAGAAAAGAVYEHDHLDFLRQLSGSSSSAAASASASYPVPHSTSDMEVAEHSHLHHHIGNSDIDAVGVPVPELDIVRKPTIDELTDEPIIARARHALVLNQNYQKLLFAQYQHVDQARQHVVELQARLKETIIKNRVAIQQSTPFRRNAPPFFVDKQNSVRKQ